MTWPPTLEDLIPESRTLKGVCVGAGIAALALIGVGVWRDRAQSHRADMAEARALKQEGRADAAENREAQAKVEKAAAEQVAAQWSREVARLRAERDALPPDPGPQPVPADAPVQVVAGGLRSLGLNPQVLGVDPALGLSLQDGRTALGWGVRLGPVEGRLESTLLLSEAQAKEAEALRARAEADEAALAACDEGKAAQASRADFLAEALRRRPVDRLWSVGGLVGMDTSGALRFGAYVTRAWGPAQVQLVVIGNQAAIGGGFRF